MHKLENSISAAYIGMSNEGLHARHVEGDVARELKGVRAIDPGL